MHIVPADEHGILQASELIQSGLVVAHATETCYGLAADLTNPLAVARLFAIKRRRDDQPVSGLFTSAEAAKEYVEWNSQAEELSDARLPGPLTLVLPVKADAPFVLYPTPAGGDSLGVRVSSHPIAHGLATACAIPLSTTSANVSGEANPYSVDDIVRQFAGLPLEPDLVLDSGPLPANEPSEVISLLETAQKILRPGKEKS